MNGTLKDILNRRSSRAFKSEQISEEELTTILEAGLAAPSSKNLQPWHFTVIQNEDLIDWMVSTNREIVLASPELTEMSPWVQAPDYHNFYHAPTVILISGEKKNPWYACDCGHACENMCLAAQSLSIGSCIIASNRYLFETEKAAAYIDELGIPDGYVPVYALSLGYESGEHPEATARKKDCINYIR